MEYVRPERDPEFESLSHRFYKKYEFSDLFYTQIPFSLPYKSMNISITLPNKQENIVALEELFLQTPYIILYFYPKDNTPGCTIEANDFNQLYDQFHSLGCQIIWVSKDSHTSHCSFQSKYGLQFPLIVDKTMELAKKFDVVGEKSMFGKKYTGILRSTFLLDTKGTIIQERKNISANNHAKNVLEKVTKVVMDK